MDDHPTARTGHGSGGTREDLAPPGWRYDPATMVLHWIVAVGVAAQWLGAHAIDSFPPGPLRVDVRSVHICVGAVLLAVLVFRAVWRLRCGRSFERSEHPVLRLASPAMHLVLYGLTGAVLILGIFNTWLRGDSLFGWFHIAKYGDFGTSERHQYANQVVALHRNAANLLLVLAATHATAAIAHHVLLRDDVLRRMTPRWALR